MHFPMLIFLKWGGGGTTQQQTWSLTHTKNIHHIYKNHITQHPNMSTEKKPNNVGLEIIQFQYSFQKMRKKLP